MSQMAKTVIFDEGGFLQNHVMGLQENEKELRFFLAENESLSAFDVQCIQDLEIDLDAEFVGIFLETDVSKIVVDDFFKTNCLVGGDIVDEPCLVAVFRK